MQSSDTEDTGLRENREGAKLFVRAGSDRNDGWLVETPKGQATEIRFEPDINDRGIPVLSYSSLDPNGPQPTHTRITNPERQISEADRMQIQTVDIQSNGAVFVDRRSESQGITAIDANVTQGIPSISQNEATRMIPDYKPQEITPPTR